MSEILAEIAIGALNKSISNINKTDQSYLSKNNWESFEFSRDLDEHNSIKNDHGDEDFVDNMNESLFSEQKIVILEQTNKKFNIEGNVYNIIDEISFIMENGEYEDMNDIMNSTINIEFGGSSFDGKILMEYNMLLCNLLNKKIVYDTDIIIPSAQIELLKNNFKQYKKSTKCDGFILFSLSFHRLCINLESKIRNCKLIVKYRDIIDESFKNKICGINFDVPIFGMSIERHTVINNKTKKNLRFNHISKFMFIKIHSDEQQLININNIKLYLCEQLPITFNMFDSEIMELNLFENRYLLISVSPSFKNINNLINNLQQGNLDKYGINLSRIDTVGMEIEDIDDCCKIDICNIYVNIARITQGLIGLLFSN